MLVFLRDIVVDESPEEDMKTIFQDESDIGEFEDEAKEMREHFLSFINDLGHDRIMDMWFDSTPSGISGISVPLTKDKKVIMNVYWKIV